MSLEAVVAKVLSVPVESINDETGPETLMAWSSVRHLALIFEVEKHFNLKLEREEVFGVTSVGALKEILKARGAL